MNPVARLSEEGLVIFLFHGVIEKDRHQVRNYTRKHLTRDFFARLMTDLAAQGRALSLDQVVDHHLSKRPYPPRAFALTFDDGFENNFSLAAPILADLGLPATFYLTTGFIEDNAMSWIDRIEYCLEVTDKGRLRLPWDGRERTFAGPKEKIELLDYIRAQAKTDPRLDLDRLVSEVFSQCGQEEISQSDDPLDLKMSWDQVRDLAGQELFSLGGHTHRHPVLSFLDADELDREIRTSLDLLQQKAGVGPRHYSYPEGLAYCFSPQVIEALKSRGVVCCPTAEAGLNRAGDDLFYLKRVPVVG
ncbi:MAG: polysaccharide deacetylase family protein [Deltaproteobacteria bacterium]|nr:polysaccharide deacetylase family protein [Deltaproteobacteria bacterium]